MDGMNEAGFAISVLHLDGKPTQQNIGNKKLTTTVAMRYLLDKDGKTTRVYMPR